MIVSSNSKTATLTGSTTSILDWATSTSYVVGNYVQNGYVLYKCTSNHTSTTFAADSSKWAEINDLAMGIAMAIAVG
jgi:hypothetical protein